MTIPFDVVKERLLDDPETRAAYEALAQEYEIAANLIRARLSAGLTQAEVANRMGTTQSTVARLESGKTMPSTKTLARFAAATGTRVRIDFVPRGD